MGRKLIHDTPEKKAAARAADRAKFTNITLDNEAVKALQQCKVGLGKELGFTPTLSQTVRYLIAKANS
jgi:hypothetical protein